MCKIKDLTCWYRRGGHCAKYLTSQGHLLLAKLVSEQSEMTLGDALVIRDMLIEGGFRFGRDFVMSQRLGDDEN